MKYVLLFKGPEGALHFILDKGMVYSFSYETIPLMAGFKSDCALYELRGTKMYLVSNMGFREDFPIRKILTLNEQALFARPALFAR